MGYPAQCHIWSLVIGSLLMSSTSCDPAAELTEANVLETEHVQVGSLENGLRRRELLLITDGDAWSKTWRRIWSAASEESPPLPAVDFRHQSVVIAALGSRPSAGYRLTIEVIKAVNEEFEILVSEHKPGYGCTAAAVVTYPIAVEITKFPIREARFRVREVVERCD